MKKDIFLLFMLCVFFTSGYAQINLDNLRYSAVKHRYELYRIDGNKQEQDKTFSEFFKKKDTTEKKTTLDKYLQYALSPLYVINVNSLTHSRDDYPMIIAKRTAIMSQVIDIEPQAPLEIPKDVQPIRIPYSVDVKYDENEIKIYSDRFRDITYRFHTGKYLKSAINYYLYPHFDPNSGKAISLYISTSDISCVEGDEEKKEKGIVHITLRTEVYYNGIILYKLYTSKILSDYSVMWEATQNAIFEAVKKIPNEVAWFLSNPEEARLKLKKEINPQIPYDFIAFANLSRFSNHYEEAIVAAKRAIEINPTEPEAYAVLGLIYQDQKKYKDAEENFKKAISLNPEFINFYLQLANLYYEKEFYNEAVNTLTKALEINPSNIEANYLLIKAYMAMGQFDKAIEMVNETIKNSTMIDKKASIFFAQRSLCYREKGNLDQAMNDAEKAYSLNSNLDDTKEALGIVYIDKGKYDEAINILSSTDKDNYFSKLLLATAYAKSGKFNEAVSVYKNIPEDYLITKSVLRNNVLNSFYITIKPYKDPILKNAKDLEAKGQYKEAIKEYANLLKISDEKEAKGIRAHIAELMIKYPHLFALPEEARKSVIKAEAFTEEGKFKKAIEEYQKALELSPFYPNLYKALALSYGQIKDYKKAIKNMNIYLELYPDAPDIRAAKDQIYKWEFMMEKGE